MNTSKPINPPAPQQTGVGSVDDSVYLKAGDVLPEYHNHGRQHSIGTKHAHIIIGILMFSITKHRSKDL